MSILPWTKYVQKPYIKIANLKIDGSTQVLRDEWREESLSSPGENFSLSNFEIFTPPSRAPPSHIPDGVPDDAFMRCPNMCTDSRRASQKSNVPRALSLHVPRRRCSLNANAPTEASPDCPGRASWHRPRMASTPDAKQSWTLRLRRCIARTPGRPTIT